MRAVVIRRFGGIEVIAVEERPMPRPEPGQLLVSVSVAGVNYRDVYERRGLTRSTRRPPIVAGIEGVGHILALGDNVVGFELGDRVSWLAAPGSHAEAVIVEAGQAVLVPKDVDDESAVALMVQGITSQFLSTSCYPVRHGDVALVHAAAGGVGILLIQMVMHRGGVVLGTASTDEKREVARSYGADEVTGYDRFADWARHRTQGDGVNAVFDGVGQSTFRESLASLRPRGVMALFGEASGPVDAVDVKQLHDRSLYLARPTLGHYTSSRAELIHRASEVFRLFVEGRLRTRIGGRYRLEEAAFAHKDLEGRRTTGKLLLLP